MSVSIYFPHVAHHIYESPMSGVVMFLTHSHVTRPHFTVSSLKKRGCVELLILGLNTNKMYMGQNKIVPWDMVIS